MEVRYKSDLYTSYIQIDIPQQINRRQYTFQMLEENPIKGILSSKQRVEEGKSYLYLDITGKKSLQQEYRDKEMELEDMTNLFQQLIAIFDEIRNFLLSDRFVLLNPEYLYIDIETGELAVVLLPWEREEEQDIRKLAEFFLKKMNQHDEQGINAAYLFYKRQSEPNFSLYQFMPVIERETILKRQRKQEALSVSEERRIIPGPELSFWEEEYGDQTEEKNDGVKPDKEKKKRGIRGWIKRLFKKKRVKPEFDLSFSSYGQESVEEEYYSCQETVFFESQEEEWGLEWKEKGRIKKAPLTPLPVTVGKIREEVSVVMADKSVSRVHCRFIDQDGGIAIMDMNSTNGTVLNGMRLRPGEIMAIAKNDEILIGKVRVLVV